MPVPAASSADGQNCRDEAAVEGGSADKAPCWEQSIEQLDPKTRGRRTQRCWSLVGGRYGVSVYKWAMGSGSWSSSQPFGLERAKMGASKVSRTASSLTRTEECSKACNGSIQKNRPQCKQTQIQKRQLTREMIVCLLAPVRSWRGRGRR
nr:uncharacterized protein LOC109767016 isoform X3 [Aegilops tauschii subsp. strangulata]